MALDAYLQATEQSLGMEFILPITCLQFRCLHPSQVVLDPLIVGEKCALSYGAIDVSVL